MSRVALVAPRARLRAMLAALADAGAAQLVGPLPAAHGDAVEALRRLERSAPGAAPVAARIAEAGPDLDTLEREGRRDLLAGEVQLIRRAEAAVVHGRFAALVAWVPSDELPALSARLAGMGAAAVELRRPAFVEPPTLLRPGRAARRFQPLVDTYGAVRYADLDPTLFAAASFVLMFGMMFGDVGHGLLLAGLGLALRRTRSPRLREARRLWAFPVAGGLAAAGFGLLYGEAFGPTGIVPTLWLEPTEEPVELLTAALAVGALLLTCGYALGILNRRRESGWRAALIAPSGVAGFGLFAGLGLLALGLVLPSAALAVAAATVATVGAALLLAGFAAEAGFGGAAVAQTAVELLDAIVRVGANLISFTRLAAFGLMHAALGAVVLDAASGLWDGGGAGVLAGAAVFAAGNAAAFALEALVAGVQAMRLEYYELFSRVFAGEGKPFRAWRIPMVRNGEPA
jgi:V/A-type H+-transporting ATPase subunit I